MDVSDEHKCGDFGHGQRDGEVQGVSDKEAQDTETGKRRLSAVEVAKHDVSHFYVRGRGYQHGKNQTIAERTLFFIGGKRGNETSVLVMVDSETGKGFAHAYSKNGSDADVVLFVLETIRTGAMRVIHIPVKRLRIKFVLYCPIYALNLKIKRANLCRK